VSLRRFRALSKRVQPTQCRPLIVLQRGDDIILLNPEARRWYLTTEAGKELYVYWHEHGQLGVSDEYSSDDVQDFVADVEDTLYGESRVAVPEFGCAVYITEACNMRCTHCRFACATSASVLDLDTIKKYLDTEYARGARQMTVTGGEPLLVWERLTRNTLAYARQLGMNTMLLTNGSLVTDEIARELAELGCVVQVSVDSADPKVYADFRNHAFKPVVRGIDRLIEAGVYLAISTTLTRRTIGEVDDVIRFALEHGASSIHFALLEPGGRAEGAWNELGLLDSELIRFFDSIADRYFGGLRESLRIDDFEMLMKQLVHPPALEGCNCAVAISALYEDGLVYGCTNLCGQERFCLGNVEDKSEHNRRRMCLVSSMPTVGQIAKCRDCEFRWVCLGGCRDRVLLTYGRLDEPDPYCDVLYSLFRRLLFEAARLIEQDNT